MVLRLGGVARVPLALLTDIDEQGAAPEQVLGVGRADGLVVEVPNNFDSTLMVDLLESGDARSNIPLGVCYSRSGTNPRGYPFSGPAQTKPEETDMELPEDVTDDLRKRLRRVAGQVQGIERMLDEGRECRDIVTQISAANRALEQAGFKLVSAGLTYCLSTPRGGRGRRLPASARSRRCSCASPDPTPTCLPQPRLKAPMHAIETTVPLPLDEAEAAVRATLADNGFGVLTEIDVAATLKAKLGVDRPALKILGACNPTLANQALELDPSSALVLPCNVVLEPGADGGTRISAVDPRELMPDPAFAELADQRRGQAHRGVCDAVGT